MGRTFFLKIIVQIAPIVIAESATLKIGLKNSNLSPPQTGNQVGKWELNNGK